ncbi:epoxyqueuosine reductase QueH [Desulfohalovibrio reitneri]|uniref:epoxyqueuosine reductase QueH n=1 Tax=Desulfohalovibrio reitneri TaxID=1307759 RepID=UPI0004A6D5AF|nr:epoxyqueuosine reductase QueH [Desulfohalovibrio reitneri]
MAAPRVLVHVCCGPCAAYTIPALREEGFQVTALYFNPNIHPVEEYVRRRDAFLDHAEDLGADKVIVKDADYDPQAWFREITFRETNRCFHCARIRLEKTSFIAKRGQFDHFTTTLLYSKHQKHDEIAALGRDLGPESAAKARFLYRDFREGWQQGIHRSKDLGMYRQDYCGCLYSDLERRKKLLAK